MRALRPRRARSPSPSCPRAMFFLQPSLYQSARDCSTNSQLAVKHRDCRIGDLLDSHKTQHKTQARIVGCRSVKIYLMRSQQSTTRVVHHVSEARLPSTTPVHHACQQVREARRFYRTCFSCRGVYVNLSSIALLQFPSKDVLSQLQTMEFNWVNYQRGNRKILKTEDDYLYIRRPDLF